MALQAREKKLLKILGAVVVLSGIILYFAFRPAPEEDYSQEPSEEVQEAQERATGASGTPRRSSGGGGGRAPAGGGGGSVGPSLISLDVFENHSTTNDCWVIIQGSVYDITGYLQSSGQADELDDYCGTLGFESGFLNDSPSAGAEIIQQASLVGELG